MNRARTGHDQRLTRSAALRPINRRTVLRGAGMVALALPWLEGMVRPAGAQAAGTPKRFVVCFSPNGNIRDNWLPTGSETDFQLGRILMPLNEHKKNLVVIDGLDQNQGGAGDNHMRGMGGMLTGMPINTGPWNPGNGGWANGISVDQEIANKIGNGTKFRSLELGVLAGLGGVPGGDPVSVWTRMSYAGADKPLHPENSPSKVFSRVFGELDAGASEIEATRLRARRRSIIDATRDAYSSFVTTLGGDDKKRVESHLSAIREIETSLGDGAPGALAGCQKPVGIGDGGDPAAIGKAQMDLMVRALACDVTRVASLQWSHSVGGVAIPGVGGDHHDLSHADEGNLDAKESLTVINTWYAQQFGYLLARMKEVPEGGGTMLDNSLVIMVNELATGNNHLGEKALYVLAGGAGGALATGRFLTYPRTSHNNLLVSLLNLMGVPATTFGLPEWCTGPLSRLA